MRLIGPLTLAFAMLLGAAGLAQSPSRLYVFATDANGLPVENLTLADFDVKANGSSCQVTAARHGTDTMRLILLVDNSPAATTLLTPLERGLQPFASGLPADVEIGLVTVSAGYSLRLAPTLDRRRLSSSIGSIRDEDEGTQVAKALMESEAKLFRDQRRWPVYVIVTTDASEDTSMIKQVEFDAFSQRLQTTASTVHAVLITSPGNTQGAKVIGAMTKNLTQNSGGLYREITDARALPEALGSVVGRIADDARRMAAGYELTYVGCSMGAGALEVGTARQNVTLRPSMRRVP